MLSNRDHWHCRPISRFRLQGKQPRVVKVRTFPNYSLALPFVKLPERRHGTASLACAEPECAPPCWSACPNGCRSSANQDLIAEQWDSLKSPLADSRRTRPGPVAYPMDRGLRANPPIHGTGATGLHQDSKAGPRQCRDSDSGESIPRSNGSWSWVHHIHRRRRTEVHQAKFRGQHKKPNAAS